ncbi:MAG: NAD(P)H-binding protein [Sphingorhabdus sp.]
MKKIVIAGATGLIGKQVIALLADRQDVETHILVRRQPDTVFPNIKTHVADPADWSHKVAAIAPDVAISCLGTTMRTAGSKAAFRAVDFDLIVSVARAAKAAGAEHMIAVSSTMAKPDSNNFYLKTKGETEAAILSLGFERTDFMRPGLLTGGRRPDSRPGETIGIMLSPLTDLLLVGKLRRYRSIPSAIVARAIVKLALGDGEGQHIHENDAIRVLAG